MSADEAFDLSHFDRLGAAYDAFLPYLQPVADAIFARLPNLGAGATVLDLACGTGEPGLALARRAPEIRLLGVDAAEGMIAVARGKAAAEALGNARFEAMPLDVLRLEDASVDAAVSRFGFLLFGEPAASAAELARVLRPDGRFSFAVWEGLDANTFISCALKAFGRRIEPERMPRLDQFEALAAPGRREGLLRDAGLRHVESAQFHWSYEFADAGIAWDFATGPGMFATLAASLEPEPLEEVRRYLTDLLAPYRGPDGGYSVPQACRLFWGRR